LALSTSPLTRLQICPRLERRLHGPLEGQQSFSSRIMRSHRKRPPHSRRLQFCAADYACRR